MSAEYVRRAYGVDYKRGDRLVFDGKPGTLVSFPGPHLGIRLDGETRTSRCHPTWRIERELDPAELVVCNALRALDCATGAVDPVDPEDCASVATEAVRALRAAGMLR